MTGRLVSVSVGCDLANARRVRALARTAARDGIRFDQILIGDDADEATCLAVLTDLAERPNVTGILLQPALPDHLHHATLNAAIPSEKRVAESDRLSVTEPALV